LRGALPRPLEVVARATVVAAALLWLVNACASAIVQPFIPALQGIVEMTTDDFRILDMGISNDRGARTLRVRADLAHALVVSGKVLMPINSGSGAGWMEAHLALGGILQYPLLLCIVVMAWPAAGAREWLARACFALPLLALLFFVAVPSTIIAELWFPIHDDYAPDAFWPSLVWSRFLMGGGGQVLGLLFGICSIGLGVRIQSRAP
jgi:hypothetical protein